MLLAEDSMEELRRMMRGQAAFCGLEVLTYCFLGNHFHIFIRLDPKATEVIDDAELLRRFRALYGSKRCASLGVDAERLEAVLKLNGAAAAALRQRLQARMGRVPVYMRELKTRFTLWYNERKGTVGTFWAERYRSVLVEAGSRAEKLVAAYIDLNPVRAGIVDHPEAYPFSGYGEACAGRTAARRGIARIEGTANWTAGVMERYAARLREPKGLSAASAKPAARNRRSPRDETAGIPKGSPSSGTLMAAAQSPGIDLRRKTPAFSEGRAVGSAAWTEGLCGPDGCLPYSRHPKPKALVHDESNPRDTIALVRWRGEETEPG